MEQIEQIILREKYHKLEPKDIKDAKNKIKMYYGFIPPGHSRCQITMANLRQKVLVSPSKAKVEFLLI